MNSEEVIVKRERVKEGLPLEQYLDIEQQLLQTVTDELIFSWIVEPTVIYGHHQVREQEVNDEYCSRHNVRVVQRKSGGGCVYADKGNLMISFVSPSTHSIEVFERFLKLLATGLRRLGYEAVTTAHNDVLVDGHKVAGTACYTSEKGTLVHACMLYDSDLEALTEALKPPMEKLTRHAVQSVRQRVINLKDLIDQGPMSAFREKLMNTICSEEF
ncbi:MAG: lipoate--protein ligase family protein [Paludibacteraceae bacterium]|nr:lipoate--protein ligase family protein [Paludibacteraceae bacterium]